MICFRKNRQRSIQFNRAHDNNDHNAHEHDGHLPGIREHNRFNATENRVDNANDAHNRTGQMYIDAGN